MTDKHTPGPWVVGGPWPAVNVCYIEEEDHWESIVERWDYRDGEAPDEVKANAHLIAAAPELLEACRLALRYIEEEGFTPEDEEAIRVLLSAVIRKAKGVA